MTVGTDWLPLGHWVSHTLNSSCDSSLVTWKEIAVIDVLLVCLQTNLFTPVKEEKPKV